MYMRLLKFNHNHDMLGRFATADMGRPDEMTAMFARVAQPDGGFTWSPTAGEPKVGFAVSIHPDRSAVFDKLGKRDLLDYLKKNLDLLRQPGNNLGAWHDPESGKVFLDVSMVTQDVKEAERLCLKHDQIAYFDLSTHQSVTVNRSATSGGVVSHDKKHAAKADALHVGGLVSLDGGRSEGVHRAGHGREDDGGRGAGGERPVGFFSILKFNKNHDIKDGRFASGGLNNADFNATDRKIIDLKASRSMTDPREVKTLTNFVPGSSYVPYTKLPFFKTLMQMQGTDMAYHTGAEQKAARDVLLTKQPIETVPIAGLTFTQNVVNEASVKNFKAIAAKAVQVARYGGKLYLLDGHHRVAYEALQGTKNIDAYVLNLDKVHKWAQVLKFNPNHMPKGPKGGQFAPKGMEGATEQVPTVAQALAKGYNRPVSSAEVFRDLTPAEQARINAMDRNVTEKLAAGMSTHLVWTRNHDGTHYLPERVLLHNEVLNAVKAEMDKFKAQNGERPLLTILGGRGGSGKSQLSGLGYNESGTPQGYVLDGDAVKAMLSKAANHGAWNGAEAGLWHEEGDQLVNQLTQYARVNNINLVMDLTMKSDKTGKVLAFRNSGFDLKGSYMFLPPKDAATRSARRALSPGGRYVPTDVIVGTTGPDGKQRGGNYGNEKNFDRLTKYFNKGFSVYHNMVKWPEPPVVVVDHRSDNPYYRNRKKKGDLTVSSLYGIMKTEINDGRNRQPEP